MKYIFLVLLSIFIISCDSSIKEFNAGFTEGYKVGLKSNSCKELKDKNRKWKNKSFRDGFIKGHDAGVIDCIKIMKAQDASM